MHVFILRALWIAPSPPGKVEPEETRESRLSGLGRGDLGHTAECPRSAREAEGFYHRALPPLLTPEASGGRDCPPSVRTSDSGAW